MKTLSFTLKTLLLMMLVSSTGFGQDLIEKARLGSIEPNSSSYANNIAFSILQKQSQETFVSKSIFSLQEQDLLKSVQTHVKDAVFFNLKSNEHQTLFQDKSPYISLSLPVTQTKNIELELMRVEEVVTPDYQLRTSDGQTFTFDETQGIAYRGIVKNDPNSMVALSVFENQVRALIVDDKGNYVLGKMQDGSENYILYNDKNLKHQQDFHCEVVPNPDVSSSPLPTKGANTSSSFFPGDCVEIYVECDFAMFVSQGTSVANVNNFVFALMNETGILYANENITITLSETFVWTNTDPYAIYDNTGDVLNQFTNNSNANGYNGRLGHFITTRNIGGGRAYLDVLCSNSIPYGVSGGMSSSITPVPTYSWNVMVFAHELGHNFGSPHTQSCTWGTFNNEQIDDCGNFYFVNNGSDDDNDGSVDELDEAEGFGCYDNNNPIIPSVGGTIMSYCHLNSVGINFNEGFGPEPGDLIRNRYNNASCLTTCTTDGCTDPNACNYNPNFINDDGSCEYVSCAGCTDPAACNFNTTATIDDSSCDYTSCPGVYCLIVGGNSNFEWIQEISLGSFTNVSGNNGGYGDYTNLSTNLLAGQTYNINLTPAFADQLYDEYWSVYIDWNHDFTFDASEEAFETTAPSQVAVSGTITVPTNAVLDSTLRMRVIMQYAQPPAGPCGSIGDGEVEEYSIIVNTLLAGCMDPTACNFNPAANMDDGSCETISCDNFCEGATSLACGDVIVNSTSSASNTDNPSQVSFCNNVALDLAASRWYTFMGNGDSVLISTCNSMTNFDTKLFVYTGDCDGLICFTANDDMIPACPDNFFHSQVAFPTIVGTTYYVLVTGYGFSSGDYVLSVNCPNTPVCQPSLHVTGNVYGGLYQASNDVHSDSATVITNDTVTFHAGNYIDLLEDFEVTLGAQFTADIQDCDTPPVAKPVETMNQVSEECPSESISPKQ